MRWSQESRLLNSCGYSVIYGNRLWVWWYHLIDMVINLPMYFCVLSIINVSSHRGHIFLEGHYSKNLHECTKVFMQGTREQCKWYFMFEDDFPWSCSCSYSSSCVPLTWQVTRFYLDHLDVWENVFFVLMDNWLRCALVSNKCVSDPFKSEQRQIGTYSTLPLESKVHVWEKSFRVHFCSIKIKKLNKGLLLIDAEVSHIAWSSSEQLYEVHCSPSFSC